MTALLLATLLAATAAPDAAEPTPAPAPVPEATPAQRAEWFGVPALFYTPETSVGGGGFVGHHFTMGEKLPISSAHALAVVTARAQVVGSLDARLFLDRRFVLSAALGGAIYPDLFYGIGPRAPRAAEEEYTSRRVDLTATPQLVVLPGLRVGPRLHFHGESMSGVERGGLLEAAGGARAFSATGAGAAVTWDGRDSQFQPRAGTFGEATFTWYPAALGDRAFSRGSLDLRAYAPLPRAHVLALATRVDSAWGDVPPTLLPRLGGSAWGRGYREGRWRDRLAMTAQVEDRFPIAGKFRGAVFLGAGEVAGRVRELDGALLRPFGGAGVRYRLSDTGASLRADLGVGAEGVAFYFVGMEAF